MMKRCFAVFAVAGIVLVAGLGRGDAFQAVTTNLQGYWPLDTFASNSTPDASGNNHPATQATAGSQPATAAGMFNGALTFDGSADFLSVPDTAVLNAGTGNFSIAAWVRPGGTTADRIVNKWNNATTTGWLLDINAGNGGAASPGFLRLKMSDGTNTVDYSVNAGLVVGAWTHIAATVDRGTDQLRLYANATQIGTTQGITALTGTLTSPAALGIGNIPSTAGNYYAGALDEVRYYSAALTQPQLFTLVQPLAPTALTATPSTAYNTRQIDLTWTASAGSHSYRVLRSTTSGSGYVQIASGLTGTTYSDSAGLAYDTDYFYVVRGFNTVEGPNSNQAMARIVRPPPRTEEAGSGEDHMCNVSTVGAPGPAGLIAGLLGLALLLAALRKAS